MSSGKRKKLRKTNCNDCGEEHIISPFFCPQCDYQVNCPAFLEIHMDDAHNKTLDYMCPLECDIACSGYADLENHITGCHGYILVTDAEYEEYQKKKRKKKNDAPVPSTNTETVTATQVKQKAESFNTKILSDVVDLTLEPDEIKDVVRASTCEDDKVLVRPVAHTLETSSVSVSAGDNEIKATPKANEVETVLQTKDVSCPIEQGPGIMSTSEQITVPSINSKQTPIVSQINNPAQKCSGNEKTSETRSDTQNLECSDSGSIEISTEPVTQAKLDKKTDQSSAKTTISAPFCEVPASTESGKIGAQVPAAKNSEKSVVRQDNLFERMENFKSKITDKPRNSPHTEDKVYDEAAVNVQTVTVEIMSVDKASTSDVAKERTEKADDPGNNNDENPDDVKPLINSDDSDLPSINSGEESSESNDDDSKKKKPKKDRLNVQMFNRSKGIISKKTTETKGKGKLQKLKKLAVKSNPHLISKSTEHKKAGKENAETNISAQPNEETVEEVEPVFDPTDVDFIDVNANGTYKCTKCKLWLKTEFEVRMHCKIKHLPMRPYGCSSCKFFGKTPTQYLDHVKVKHSDEITYRIDFPDISKEQHDAWSLILDCMRKKKALLPTPKQNPVEVRSKSISSVQNMLKKRAALPSMWNSNFTGIQRARDSQSSVVPIIQNNTASKPVENLTKKQHIEKPRELPQPKKVYSSSSIGQRSDKVSSIVDNAKKISSERSGDHDGNKKQSENATDLSQKKKDTTNDSQTKPVKDSCALPKSSGGDTKAKPSKPLHKESVRILAHKPPERSVPDPTNANSPTIYGIPLPGMFHRSPPNVTLVPSSGASPVLSTISTTFASMSNQIPVVSGSTIVGQQRLTNQTQAKKQSQPSVLPIAQNNGKTTSNFVLTQTVAAQPLVVTQNRFPVMPIVAQNHSQPSNLYVGPMPSTLNTGTLLLSPGSQPAVNNIQLSSNVSTMQPVTSIAANPVSNLQPPKVVVNPGHGMPKLLLPVGTQLLVQKNRSTSQNVILTTPPVNSVSSPIPRASSLGPTMPVTGQPVATNTSSSTVKSVSTSKSYLEKSKLAANASKASFGPSVETQAQPVKSSNLNIGEGTVSSQSEVRESAAASARPTNTVRPILTDRPIASGSYQCPLCSVRNTEIRVIYVHMKELHMNFEPYTCNCTRTCTQTFRTVYSCMEHMSQKHSPYPQMLLFDISLEKHQNTACEKLFPRIVFEKMIAVEKEFIKRNLDPVHDALHLGTLSDRRYRVVVSWQKLLLPSASSSLTAATNGQTNMLRTLLNEAAVPEAPTTTETPDVNLSSNVTTTAEKSNSVPTQAPPAIVASNSTSMNSSSTSQVVTRMAGITPISSSHTVESTKTPTSTSHSTMMGMPPATISLQASATVTTGSVAAISTTTSVMSTSSSNNITTTTTTAINTTSNSVPQESITTKNPEATSSKNAESLQPNDQGKGFVLVNGQFECTKCKDRFDVYGLLVNHLKAVHVGVTPFECFTCHHKYHVLGDAICHIYSSHDIVNQGLLTMHLSLLRKQEPVISKELKSDLLKSYTNSYKTHAKDFLVKKQYVDTQGEERVIAAVRYSKKYFISKVPDDFLYWYEIRNGSIEIRRFSQCTAIKDAECRAASTSRRSSVYELERGLPAYLSVNDVDIIEVGSDESEGDNGNNKAENNTVPAIQPVTATVSIVPQTTVTSNTAITTSESVQVSNNQTMLFNCRHCTNRYKILRCLLVHTCKHHYAWKPFLCVKCADTYSTMTEFFVHMLNGCQTRKLSVSLNMYKEQKVAINDLVKSFGDNKFELLLKKLKDLDFRLFTPTSPFRSDSAILYILDEANVPKALKYAETLYKTLNLDVEFTENFNCNPAEVVTPSIGFMNEAPRFQVATNTENSSSLGIMNTPSYSVATSAGDPSSLGGIVGAPSFPVSTNSDNPSSSIGIVDAPSYPVVTNNINNSDSDYLVSSSSVTSATNILNLAPSFPTSTTITNSDQSIGIDSVNVGGPDENNDRTDIDSVAMNVTVAPQTDLSLPQNIISLPEQSNATAENTDEFAVSGLNVETADEPSETRVIDPPVAETSVDEKNNDVNDSGPLSCPKCEYEDVKMNNLIRHFKTAHLDYKPFVCSSCSYSCEYLGDFIIHSQTDHSNPGESCKLIIDKTIMEKQDQAVMFSLEQYDNHFDVYMKFHSKFLSKHFTKLEDECDSVKRLDIYKIKEKLLVAARKLKAKNAEGTSAVYQSPLRPHTDINPSMLESPSHLVISSVCSLQDVKTEVVDNLNDSSNDICVTAETPAIDLDGEGSVVTIKAMKFAAEYSKNTYESLIRSLGTDIESINSTLACYLCNEEKSRTDLMKHFESNHVGLTPFSCSECAYSASNEGSVRSHIETEHSDKGKVETNKTEAEQLANMMKFFIAVSVNMPKRGKSLLDHMPCHLQCRSMSTCKPCVSISDMHLHILSTHFGLIKNDTVTCMKECNETLLVDKAFEHYHNCHPDYVCFSTLTPVPLAGTASRLHELLKQVTVVPNQDYEKAERYLVRAIRTNKRIEKKKRKNVAENPDNDKTS